MTINGQTVTTPIEICIFNEPSISIGKFIVVLPDGTRKEYKITTSKTGKLVIN